MRKVYNLLSRNLVSNIIRVMLLGMMIISWGSVKGEVVTYKQTSETAVQINSGTAPTGSTASFSTTYTNMNQLTSGNSMTLTLTGYAGYKISSITLSMKSNASKGAGSFSMIAGSTTLSSISDSKFNTSNWNGAWSTDYVDITPSMSNSNYTIQNGEDVVITISASANSIYCQSFKITYEQDSPTPSQTYTVNFDAGNGSCSTSSLTEASAGAGVTLPTATPSSACATAGWTFAGWATASCTETTTAPNFVGLAGDTYNPTENCTLYAVYKQEEELENIDVTYDFTAISGFSDWGSSYAEHIVNYSDAIVTFSNANHSTVTITNQPVNKGGEVIVVATNSNKIKSVEFICQQWTTKTQTITLHYSTDGGINYATTGTTSSNFTIANNTLPNNTNATKITFSSQSNQIGITTCSLTIEKSTSTFNSNPSCSAPTTATITYNANGGTGTTESQTDNIGATVQLRANGFTAPTGKYFTGWNTSANGSGTSYNAGSNYTLASNITLYAQWASYTITAVSNNETLGSVETNGFVITATPEDCAELSSVPYTITSGTATVSQNGNTFTVTPTSNCTIRINFIQKPRYDVTWHVSGQADDVDNYCTGESITAPSNPASCDGTKVFVGWSTTEIDETDIAPTLLSGSQITGTTVSSNLNYYAVFADIEGSEESWAQVTNIEDITEGIYVIVSAGYYLPNTNTGSSYAPSAETLTNTIQENAIEGEISIDMQWAFTGSSSAMTIRPNIESTTYYLYETNDNNGLRVHTTSSAWSFETNGVGTFAMKGAKNRYCAVYNNQDWRSYTTATHSNYMDGGKLYLYKKSGGASYSAFTTSCCTGDRYAVSFSPSSFETYTNFESNTLVASHEGSVAGTWELTCSPAATTATIASNGTITFEAATAGTYTLTAKFTPSGANTCPTSKSIDIIVNDCKIGTPIPSDAFTENSITLNWEAITDAEKYEIVWNNEVTPIVVTTNSAVITDLEPCTTYSYTIKAVPAEGSGQCESDIYTGSAATRCTILEPGDLAIIGINNTISTPVAPGGQDEISFVIFKDIAPGTSIDFTDNGYERVSENRWGTTEGIFRLTWNGASALGAGSIITITEAEGDIGANGTYENEYVNRPPVIGGNITIYTNGTSENQTDWNITTLADGPLDLNDLDQIWFMQGGSWLRDNYTDNHNAYYTGNVLYGFTASGWKSSYGYSNSKGSTLYPSMQCFSTNIQVSNGGMVKYTGDITEATKREWISRINDSDNWTGYSNATNYINAERNYRTYSGKFVVIDGEFSTGKWSGNKSDNWCECANWVNLTVPDENTDVTIPSVNTETQYELKIYAGVENTAKCKSLEIDGGKLAQNEDGAYLYVKEGISILEDGTFSPESGNHLTITIGGDITNNGTFKTTDKTSLIMTSTTSQSVAAVSEGNFDLNGLSMNASNNSFGDDIYLHGNLTDQSTTGFTEDQTVNFVGSDSQQVTTATTIPHMIMNNASGVTLNGMLTISKDATFTDGVITGNATFEANSTTSGASASSYIDGRVTKRANASAFVFPTGSDGVLGSISVNSLSSDATAKYNHSADGFTTEDLPNWWQSDYMCEDNVQQFDHVSNAEFWKISSASAITNATFIASAATDLDANAHYNANTPEYTPSEIQMSVFGNCWVNVGGNASVDNTHQILTVTGVNLPATGRADKITTFASLNPDVILPIEIVDFNAECKDGNVKISWITASEKDNNYFILEKSTDASDFVEIARIKGAGNSTAELYYEYFDKNNSFSNNYYRLKQVDFNGETSTSEIIVVRCLDYQPSQSVSVFPNPFNNEFSIVLDNYDGEATMEIFDMLGQNIYTCKTVVDGKYETTINLDLAPSSYTLRITTNDGVWCKTIIKN